VTAADLEYADDFRVTVDLVEDKSETVGEEAWILQFPAGVFDQAAVRRAVSDALGEGPERPPFILTDTRHVHSWGAFAAFEQIAVAILAGLASDAVYDRFLTVFRSVRDRVENRSRMAEGALGREEALERARWYATEHYGLGVDPDELALLSEEERPEVAGWTFGFAYGETAYEVELREADGLSAFVRIRRRRL